MLYTCEIWTNKAEKRLMAMRMLFPTNANNTMGGQKNDKWSPSRIY